MARIDKALDSCNALELTFLMNGGADKSANRTEFADGTLGTVFSPETSSIGVVTYSSSRNTNKLIPLSSGYAVRMMNALGAPEVGITAIDAMSRGVGPGLIIYAPSKDKSALAIVGMMDQDACY
jgi:hypothetical protein